MGDSGANRSPWAKAHWVVGLAALVAFLLEGAYMRYGVRVSELADAPRLIYRSRFLLLLMAGVANLALAFRNPSGRLAKAASAVLLIAPALLVAGFVRDPAFGVHGGLLTTWTMRGLFAAALLLAVTNRPPPN